MQRLQQLNENLELKTVHLRSVDVNADVEQEDDELIALSDVWKAKLLKRIHELNAQEQNAAEQSKSAQGMQTPESNEQSQTQGNQVKEQQVENTWGKFSGDVYEWKYFHGEFDEKVHKNANIDEAAKQLKR